MKRTFLITLSVFTALTLFSCKSKPEPEAEPKEAPVETVEEDKEPEEPTLKQADKTSKEGAVKVEITDESVTVDNTVALSKIEDSRKAAVEAGAEEFAAEQLKILDDLYNELKSKETDVTDAAKELVSRYETLTNYIKAKSIKQKIDTNDLANFDRANYDKGTDNLVVVETAYAANDATSEEIIKAADAAYSCFNKVYIAAYKKLAKDERVLALEAKKNADSVKAGVSRKSEYSEATKVFQEGDSLYAMQSPEKALARYTSAKETYTVLFNEVSEKRAAAQKAIEEAKRRVAESELFAEQADENVPITEPVEGIEEEDTVLLEADEYENPEDAVIEVSETLDGEEESSDESLEKSEIKESENEEFDDAEAEEDDSDESEDDEDSEEDSEEAADSADEAQEE